MTGPSSEPPAAPYVPHDTGKEARRRVMVGLAGLVFMLLLVMLAGFLTGQARQEAEVAKAQAEAAGVANPGSTTATAPSPTEPLGDVAIDPNAAPLVTVPGAAVLPEADGTITVPDLQPDPELEASKRRQ